MTTTTIDRPRARRTDPSTSHDAADSVRNVRISQEWVIRALRRPADDTELIERYRNLSKAPRQSESGIRTRRSELVEMGLVYDSGDRRILPSGRSAIVWALNHDLPQVKAVFGR